MLTRGDMTRLREESLLERLGEQIETIIAGAFAEHLKLDATSEREAALERRLNAVIDAARERAAPRRGPDRAGIEAEELGWVLDSLVENAPAMLFLKRATDLAVELWNKQAERISGVKASEILGKTGWESFPPAEMEAFNDRDRAVLEGKRLVAAEETLTSPAGEARWIYTKKIPLLDESGVPRYLLGISEDITERKLATEELRRTKDAAESANQAKTDFLANVSHELRTPLTLIKPFSARQLVARVRTTLTLARLRRELEEKQRARDAAEQANRLKDEFLATVSHELRTPLNAVMGWASVLRGRAPSAATLAKGLDVIERNAAAQKAIIDDLLDVSRITTGRLRLELELVDLEVLARDTIDVVMPSARARQISSRRASRARARSSPRPARPTRPSAASRTSIRTSW